MTLYKVDNYSRFTSDEVDGSISPNVTELIEDPSVSLGAAVAISLVFTILVIVGIFGNMLVCIVVARRPKMRTVINLFIFNLAASDLLLCIVGVPLTLISFLKNTWILGLALCRLSQMITALLVFVSSLTLTVIAADRFCLVVYPFMKPIDKIKCAIAIAVIWAVSIAFMVPIGLQTYVMDFRQWNGGIRCIEYWDVVDYRMRYTIALFVIQFCYPMILVTIAHACIAIKLARTNKPGSRRAESDHRENKRRQRMNKMLSSVVLVFGICWSPYNIYTFLQEFRVNHDYSTIIFIVTYFVAVSSASINPIIYSWLNDNFRKEFQRMLPFVPCFRERKTPSHQPKSSGVPTASNVLSRLTDKRSQASLGTYLQPTCAETSITTKPTASPITLNDRKPTEIDTPL